MKKIFAKRLVIRILSAACVIAAAHCACFAGRPVLSAANICACLLAGFSVLVVSPLSYEGTRFSDASAAVIVAAYSLISALAGTEGLFVRLISAVSSAYVLVNMTARLFEKYSDVAALLHPSIMWHTAEGDVRMLYCLVFLLDSMTLGRIAQDGLHPVAVAVSAGLNLALYLLSYIRVRTGRTLLLGKACEEDIRRNVLRQGELGPDKSTDEYKKMATLLQRIVSVMETQRPFLDQDFDLDALTSLVYDNRSYVSRTINRLAGKHFNKFVNGYRVAEAQRLLDADPDLKLSELLLRVGFRNNVTFNSAFQEETGFTPRDYQLDLKYQRHLSSSQGREP